jgi:hypothetical protein
MHQKADELGAIVNFAKTHLKELKKLDLSLLTRLQPISYFGRLKAKH